MYNSRENSESKRGTGSVDFKKNWGVEPQGLQYEYLRVKGTRVPDHNPLNPKYRLFIKAWQRLPLPVANLTGPQYREESRLNGVSMRSIRFIILGLYRVAEFAAYGAM